MIKKYINLVITQDFWIITSIHLNYRCSLCVLVKMKSEKTQKKVKEELIVVYDQ